MVTEKSVGPLGWAAERVVTEKSVGRLGWAAERVVTENVGLSGSEPLLVSYCEKPK